MPSLQPASPPWVHEPGFPVNSTVPAQPADGLLRARLARYMARHNRRLIRWAAVCLATGTSVLIGSIALRDYWAANWSQAVATLPQALSAAGILFWLYGVLLLLVGLKGYDVLERIRQHPRGTVAHLANWLVPYHRLQHSLRWGQWGVWLVCLMLLAQWLW